MRICGKDGVGFTDEWSRFYGRQELYARNVYTSVGRGCRSLLSVLRDQLGSPVRETKY